MEVKVRIRVKWVMVVKENMRVINPITLFTPHRPNPFSIFAKNTSFEPLRRPCMHEWRQSIMEASMKKEYARFSGKIYNIPLARRFKARLAMDGQTYRAWLAEAMKGYLKTKRAPVRTPARKAVASKGGAK